MLNYIEYILAEIKDTIGSDYTIVNAVNSIEDLKKINSKPNVLIEIVSDTKDDLDSERPLNRIRKGNLTFMIYIGFQVKTDMNKSALALSKQAEIWNDLLMNFIDNNWELNDSSADFKCNIHNGILIDYYPVNNQTDGKGLIGITGNINYSLIRL